MILSDPITCVPLGQQAGILGNSITEMKAQECAYLHKVNNIIILIL